MSNTLRTWFLRLLRWAKGSAHRIILLLSWVIRSLGIYRKPGPRNDQPGKGIQHLTTAIDCAAGICIAPDMSDGNSDLATLEDEALSGKETLQHGSPCSSSISFIETGSEASSVSLQAKVGDQRSVEEKLANSSSEIPTASAVTNVAETISVNLRWLTEQTLHPVQPDVVLFARGRPVIPSSVVIFSGCHIAVTYNYP